MASPTTTATIITNSTAPIRSLYRSLLRELPLRPHPGYIHPFNTRIHAAPSSLLKGKTAIHQRIREHVSPPVTGARRGGSGSVSGSGSGSSLAAGREAESSIRDAATRQESEQVGEAKETMKRIKAAEQFALYLKAQRMYTTLLERYNPGMGMDETERTRLTARRVGMNMPKEYETDFAGKKR